MNYIKNILKHSFMLCLAIVFSTFATTVASAKTIYSSNEFLSTSLLDYFDNVYQRESYKNYLVASEYVGSNYNYATYYYMCLTDDNIDTTNALDVSSNCEKMYRIYRSNSSYILENVNDSNLQVVNSIYYSFEGKNYVIEKLLILLNIGLFTSYLSYVLLKILRS